jgi:uncharacterized membrane protein YphA (DoxX/SURF4 family)
MTHSSIEQTWWALRLTYGSVAFLAGLDKFFNLLVNWEAYLAPAASSLLPLSAGTIMRAVGIVEMLVGILILTSWTRIGAYVASVWLISIALSLVLTGANFDVAVRDVAMAVGAWTLARLTEVRQPMMGPAAARSAAARSTSAEAA